MSEQPIRRGVLLVALLVIMAAVPAARRSSAAPGPAATLEPAAYLPISFRPLESVITFGATVDSNGVPSPPATEFPPGMRYLYWNAAMIGAAGKAWRIEWLIDGARVSSLDESGVVPQGANIFNVHNYICFVEQESTSCEETTITIPPGSYTIRLVIDGAFQAEKTAIVRAARSGPTLTTRPSSGDLTIERGR